MDPRQRLVQLSASGWVARQYRESRNTQSRRVTPPSSSLKDFVVGVVTHFSQSSYVGPSSVFPRLTPRPVLNFSLSRAIIKIVYLSSKGTKGRNEIPHCRIRGIPQKVKRVF